MIARNSTDFVTPIPVRVRICVTNFTGANNAVNLFVWTTPNLWDPTQISQTPILVTRQLQLGDCTEIDRPAALVVQDSTTSGVSSGYYELLEPPADLPAPPTRSGRSGPHPIKRAYGIRIGDALSEGVSAECTLLGKDAAGNPISNDFSLRCDLKLPADTARQGVRICFGPTDLFLKSNTYQAYAPSLMEMITNPTYAPPTNMPSPYDYNWSPVTPNGCRDVIGASTQNVISGISFMIGPNDPNGNPPWVPNNVSSVIPTIYPISWSIPKD
jgi:hypothetical protein